LVSFNCRTNFGLTTNDLVTVIKFWTNFRFDADAYDYIKIYEKIVVILICKIHAEQMILWHTFYLWLTSFYGIYIFCQLFHCVFINFHHQFKNILLRKFVKLVLNIPYLRFKKKIKCQNQNFRAFS